MSSEEKKRVQRKTGRRKTITAIPPRTASIYNKPFQSRREVCWITCQSYLLGGFSDMMMVHF